MSYAPRERFRIRQVADQVSFLTEDNVFLDHQDLTTIGETDTAVMPWPPVAAESK